jgi:DNA-binding transcriptional MerR regulator
VLTNLFDLFQRNEKNISPLNYVKNSLYSISNIIDLPRVNEHHLKKLYYSIGEVASMFDVNTSLIRFWEKEFPMVKPKKNKKGNRLFTPKEVMKIDHIFYLVKENGYTLEGAKKAMRRGGSVEESETKGSDNSELIARLQTVKSKLIELKS